MSNEISRAHARAALKVWRSRHSKPEETEAATTAATPTTTSSETPPKAVSAEGSLAEAARRALGQKWRAAKREQRERAQTRRIDNEVAAFRDLPLRDKARHCENARAEKLTDNNPNEGGSSDLIRKIRALQEQGRTSRSRGIPTGRNT